MTYVAFVSLAGATGYTVYEGENTSPAGAVSGDPLTARNAFMARLLGISVEDFEGFALNTPLHGVPITRNGVSMTITKAGALSSEFRVNDFDVNGRFNTTSDGSQFLNGVTTEAGTPIVLTFSSPISAFGFYLTDLGDFLGQVSLELFINGGGSRSFDIDHTIGAPNGSLYFWGFVDQLDTYTEIRIGYSTSDDTFGIDDWVWAPAPYVI